MVTAGRLVTMGLEKSDFSHIFLDEAGHAMEPEALIPISGFFNKKKKTQVVLAGDPKQLGPVVRSPLAVKNGLQISLLERIMVSSNLKHYQRGEINSL